MANFNKIKTLLEKARLTRLNSDYNIKSFDCGDADLNDFLFNDAKTYLKHLRYTTFILETDNDIIAYYSLANDLLAITNIEDFSEEMSNRNIDSVFWESFVNQKYYPAVKIGRLGVDVKYQDKGIGTFILESLTRSFIYNNKTGCQFMTVDSINDNSQRTIRFYERNGFNLLTLNDVDKPSRLMYKSLI